MVCKIFKKSCIGRLVLFNRCIVYLKVSCTKKRAKIVQKRAKTCKNVHLKYLLTKKRASQGLIYQKACKNVQKTCKNVQKRAKTCISNVFGPYSKTCIVKVRASWGRVSRGLTVVDLFDWSFLPQWGLNSPDCAIFIFFPSMLTK